MKARHDGADRDVEDLGRVGIAEVPEIDEDDDVAEIVRERCERIDDAAL